jgi:excisionase family DNA binding protein
METQLLRVRDAAQALAISRAKAYELIARGRLGSVTIDGARRVPVSEVQRFVDRAKADAGLLAAV